MFASLVFFMFVALTTTVNAQLLCTNYTGSVCRDVIGMGPIFFDISSEEMFQAYKENYTALGVNVDAQCEAFLRAQYCGLSTFTCTDQVYCGVYDVNEIGQCGANSCKCSGSGVLQQACNEGLRIGFAAIGRGIAYYKTGQQPEGNNCTTFSIPCPSAPTSASAPTNASAPTSAASGLKFPLIGLLATAVITCTSLGVMVP